MSPKKICCLDSWIGLVPYKVCMANIVYCSSEQGDEQDDILTRCRL